MQETEPQAKSRSLQTRGKWGHDQETCGIQLKQKDQHATVTSNPCYPQQSDSITNKGALPIITERDAIYVSHITIHSGEKNGRTRRKMRQQLEQNWV